MEEQSRSEDITELMKSMFKVQSIMCMVKKGSINPHFKSRYADLADVWEAVREHLANNHLIVSHSMHPIDDNISALDTFLYHESGQWIKSTAVIPNVKDSRSIQGFGSLMTYMRRYMICAILGIVTDDDDDGNRAMAAPPSFFKTAKERKDRTGELLVGFNDCTTVKELESLVKMEPFKEMLEAMGNGNQDDKDLKVELVEAYKKRREQLGG